MNPIYTIVFVLLAVALINYIRHSIEVYRGYGNEMEMISHIMRVIPAIIQAVVALLLLVIVICIGPATWLFWLALVLSCSALLPTAYVWMLELLGLA